MSELDDALRGLVKAGWAFDWPRDENGDILVGHGARFYPGGWWDGLVLVCEHQCIAIRVDPDDRETWRREGRTLDMIHAVRELPPPRERLAPNLATGRSAPPMWAAS